MIDDWKRMRTHTLLEHPRVIVVEDDVLLPNGVRIKYLRYEGLLDYVTVIAVKGDKVALIKEYSYPHNEWVWQFPEGSIEVGESPEEAARRELQEEAALAAPNLQSIGMNYGHHRRSVEKNYIFLASDAYEIEKAQGDIEEQGAELHWFTWVDVKQMITEGQIVQKNTLAALSLYLVHAG